jgi:heterodisulfide reductase subunit A
LSAALEIANSGKKVYLVERTGELGGHTAQLDLTFPYMYSASQMLDPVIKKVKENKQIEVFLNSEIKEVYGYVGNFETTVYSQDGKETALKFGNVIMATGLKTFDPSGMENYGYGKLPNVITSLEFEKMLKAGRVLTKEGKEPQNVAIVHCVGSRNKAQHEYCSRVCCMTALKYANQVRAEFPKANIFELYADMRAFAKGCEEFYTNSSRRNIKFLMFDQENELPKITKAGDGEKSEMLISINEKLSGRSFNIPADLVVLMVAMEAQPDVKHMAHAVGVSICGNQFFIEKHPKLDPVATTTNGVYIVGSCQAPKDIPDSVAQAKAAAARILATIAKGSVQVEVTTAFVNEELCCGCQTCIKVCPYTAISYDAEKKVSVVNEILCKGCGTCGSGCPTGAIKCRHFTDAQIINQIEGLMQMSKMLEKEEV